MGKGEILRRLRGERTLEDVASKAGIARQTLSRYENNIITKIPMETIKKLADALYCSPATIMGWETKDESNVDLTEQLPIYRVPVFESVSAGLGCYADSKPVSYEYINVESPCEARETMCIKVVGDSMYPKIENGDLVQIRKQTSVDSGSIAAVLIDEDEGVVKRVVYGSDWIELHSLNPLYPPRIFKGADVQRVQIVGLVKRVIRTL